MDVKKIDNTSFGGVFRIQNTPENVAFIKDKVIPIYHTMRHQPITLFYGMNPFRDAFVETGVQMVAKAENSSTDWVKRNAELNGIDIQEKADDTIHVVTGFKDILDLFPYLYNYMEEHFSDTSLFNTLKLSYRKVKNLMEAQSENIPSHLVPLLESLIENKKESHRFQKAYLDKREVKNCESPNELLNAVMVVG